MALRIFNTTNIVTTGNAINAASNDTIIITEGVIQASTAAGRGIGSAAISVSNVSIEVQGLLAGGLVGIDMSGFGGSNTVTVAASGRVIGDTGQAMYLDGADTSVVNYGQISSYGIFSTIFFGSDRAYLLNAGTITASQGNLDAVNFEGTATPRPIR